METASGAVKYCLGACVVFGLLCFVGAADLAYGYYTFLRIFSLISLGLLIILFAQEVDTFLNPVTYVAGVLLILFNPFAPISFSKDTWSLIDILSGIAMLCLAGYICKIQADKDTKERIAKGEITETPAPPPSAPRTVTSAQGTTVQRTDARTIQRIAEQFMVTLTSEQIKAIQNSSLPTVEALAIILPKGIPDSIDFKYKLSKKCAEIVEYIKNYYDAGAELASVNHKISIFTDEEIVKIIEENAPEKGYLQGTVNYQKIAIYLLRKESENASEKLAVFPPVKQETPAQQPTTYRSFTQPTTEPEKPVFVTKAERPPIHSGKSAYNRKETWDDTGIIIAIIGLSAIFFVLNFLTAMMGCTLYEYEPIIIVLSFISAMCCICNIGCVLYYLEKAKKHPDGFDFYGVKLLMTLLGSFSAIMIIINTIFLAVYSDNGSVLVMAFGLLESVISVIVFLYAYTAFRKIENEKGD